MIVGEEVKTAQGEVIGLFLNERIEPGLSMGDTIAAIQEQGGLVYMPHPFDRLHTIPDAATLLRPSTRSTSSRSTTRGCCSTASTTTRCGSPPSTT